MVQNQELKAASCWTDDHLESEDGLVPFAFCSTTPAALQGPQSKAKAKTKAKGAAGPAGGACRPEVLAAKLRAKTTKDFCEAERLLKKSMGEAERILDDVAPRVLGADNVKDDATLDLLRERLELVEVALDESCGDDDSRAACTKLYELAVRDPYLKDCRCTLFQDEAACQTLGAVKYFRRVTMDLYLDLQEVIKEVMVVNGDSEFKPWFTVAASCSLPLMMLPVVSQKLRQPTVSHVQMAVDTHRNSLEILKKIAECLAKECSSWLSSVQAIHKSKAEEEKIRAREEAKAEKAEKMRQEKAKAKAEKAAAAEKRKQEKEQENGKDGDGEGDGQTAAAGEKKSRKPRARAGEGELCESDPPILHGVLNLEFGGMAVCTTVAGMVSQITSDPGVACVGRLRTGMLKKVMQDST